MLSQYFPFKSECDWEIEFDPRGKEGELRVYSDDLGISFVTTDPLLVGEHVVFQRKVGELAEFSFWDKDGVLNSFNMKTEITVDGQGVFFIFEHYEGNTVWRRNNEQAT